VADVLPPLADFAAAVAGGFLGFADNGAGDTNVLIDLNGGGNSFLLLATLDGVDPNDAAADLADNILVT
jgi:hypothetical protein